jgi:hypothetical protein
MYKVTPPVPFFHAPSAPCHHAGCTIVDASSLLYQPALRAAVAQEQVALLATRLAVARWTSGNAAPVPPQGHDAPPFRAAFYARAQADFFAWIEKGGVWEDAAGAVQATTSGGAEAESTCGNAGGLDDTTVE